MGAANIVLLAIILFLRLLAALVGSGTLRRQEREALRNYQRYSLGTVRLQNVQAFISESAPILESDVSDPTAMVYTLKRGIELLGLIGSEISAVGEDPEGYAPLNVQNLLLAYNTLRQFCEHGVAVIEQRSGLSSTGSEGSDEPTPRQMSRYAADAIKRWDRAVSTAKGRLVAT
jgi:hypothetical protein